MAIAFLFRLSSISYNWLQQKAQGQREKLASAKKIAIENRLYDWFELGNRVYDFGQRKMQNISFSMLIYSNATRTYDLRKVLTYMSIVSLLLLWLLFCCSCCITGSIKNSDNAVVKNYTF